MLDDVSPCPLQLEAPHVVAEIGSGDEARLCEVDEVPIQGRAIEAFARESLEELGVTDRRPEVREEAEHGDPWCRASEAGVPQDRLKIADAADTGAPERLRLDLRLRCYHSGKIALGG